MAAREGPTGDVQLGIRPPRSGGLFPVCRRRPVWPLGRLWAAQCVVGQLCQIRGLYGHAQLVFASGNDSSVGDGRHGCRNALRSSSRSRLEDPPRCFVEWSSSDHLWSGNDGGVRSEGATQFFGVCSCRWSAVARRARRCPVQRGRTASAASAGEVIVLLAGEFQGHRLNRIRP